MRRARAYSFADIDYPEDDVRKRLVQDLLAPYHPGMKPMPRSKARSPARAQPATTKLIPISSRRNVARADSRSRSALIDDAGACYRALASHDSRFDGKFFVGVRSTRIYCRPVCRVRLPQQKNCRFFLSAAAAEDQGFRPCMRCRPELAPGWAAIDSASQLARAAAHRIEATLASGESLGMVAQRIGISDRHMRRLFEGEFGVSPVAYVQTQRLLLAKRLLTDTALTVTQIAFASGFGSVRRLNASMRERYRLSPGELRKARAEPPADALRFRLPLRQPFDWIGLSGFLGSRAIGGLETAVAGQYARVVRLEHPEPVTGWIAARLVDRNRLFELTVSAGLAPVIAQVLPLARTLFDLDLDPMSVASVLGELGVARPGLRVPGAVDGFEIAVRAVLGQQITVKAARTLTERFVHAFGDSCSFAAQPMLTHAFPTPARIAAESAETIGRLGIIRRRVETIQTLATELAAGRLVLDASAPVGPTIAALKAVRGIGDWTAQYVAMRALRWPDAFPAADYGVMKALGVTTPAQATKAAEAWRPWRAYAVMHLWATLAESTGEK